MFASYQKLVKGLLVAFFTLFIFTGCERAASDTPDTITVQLPPYTSTVAQLPTAPKPVDLPPVAKPTPSPIPVVVKSTGPVSGAKIISIAEKYVGEGESKGENRSPFIDKINTFAGAPLGSPYCSSFVSWVLHTAGAKAPITAWSPTMVSKNNVSFNDIETGDVFGLYFSSKEKKRIAHVGFINNPDYRANSVLTTEANTSPSAAVGSEADRNGDGIYNKIRSKVLLKNSMNRFSRYR